MAVEASASHGPARAFGYLIGETTLSADAQTMDTPSFAGNVVDEIEIHGWLLPSSSIVTRTEVLLRVNGATTSTDSRRYQTDATTGATQVAASNISVGILEPPGTGVPPLRFVVRGRVKVAGSAARMFLVDAGSVFTNAAVTARRQMGTGVFADSSTEITSVGVDCQVASGIKAASRIWIVKGASF